MPITSITEALEHARRNGLPPPIIAGKRAASPANIPQPPQLGKTSPKRKEWLERMNGTETEYAMGLEARRRVGEISSWAFEDISFNIGEGAFYTIDFHIKHLDGATEFHEVKNNFIRDKALVAFKVARSKFSHLGEFQLHQKIKGTGWTRIY